MKNKLDKNKNTCSHLFGICLVESFYKQDEIGNWRHRYKCLFCFEEFVGSVFDGCGLRCSKEDEGNFQE